VRKPLLILFYFTGVKRSRFTCKFQNIFYNDFPPCWSPAWDQWSANI